MEFLDYVSTDDLVEELMGRMENAVLILRNPDSGDDPARLMIHAMGETGSEMADTLGLLEAGRIMVAKKMIEDCGD